VLGGMVTATVLVVVFSPLFYVLIEQLFGRRGRKDAATRPHTTTPSGDTEHA